MTRPIAQAELEGAPDWKLDATTRGKLELTIAEMPFGIV
jgi:hypothetical protein